MVLVALTDIAVYIYDISVIGRSSTPVSYPAHIAGAVTGLLMGILVLRNLYWRSYERYIWAFSVLIFILLMLVAIIWNVAVPDHFTGLAVTMDSCNNTKVL